MRISLSTPIRKAAFLGTGVAVALIFLGISLQCFLVFCVIQKPSLARVELAARLDPLDAYNFRVLGVNYLDRDPGKAETYLQRALDRNPHSARTWLDLANVYQLLGHADKQHDAILRALENAPKDIPVQWEAANLFLAQGNLQASLPMMREVAAHDPARTPAAMQVIFRASGGNVRATLDVLPSTADVRLRFLHWLIDRNDYAAAEIAWPALMHSSGPLMTSETFFYIDSLIARREVPQAQRAWLDLVARDPQLRHRMNPGNLISNGDFEDDLVNDAFGWRYQVVPGITTAMDTSTFHGGTRSVALQFESGEVKDGGLYQLVPVESGATYALSAFVHAEEVDSANGPRVVVNDYYTGNVLLLSDEFLGSFSWREASGTFTVPAETRLVKVSIGRSPDLGQIRGRFWLDDVHLEKK